MWKRCGVCSSPTISNDALRVTLININLPIALNLIYIMIIHFSYLCVRFLPNGTSNI